MYQFTMFLDQPFFGNHVVIKMPYMCLVTYNVINDEVMVLDITIPYSIIQHLNLPSLRQPVLDAAINNAISLELIGNNEIQYFNSLNNKN